MNFLNPISQINLLLFHLSRELGMGDGTQDAKHTRRCPPVSYNHHHRTKLSKYATGKNGRTPTCRPVPQILTTRSHYHMFPQIIRRGIRIAQITSIERYLVIGVLEECLIGGDSAIVSQEWRDHVHEVTPI